MERDTSGRGVPDQVDRFEETDGVLYLSQRTKDVNGDGEIDVVRFYEKGRLVRMEVKDAELM